MISFAMHQAIISKEITVGKLFRLKMKLLWPFQNSPSQGIKNISFPTTNKNFTLENKSLFLSLILVGHLLNILY